MMPVRNRRRNSLLSIRMCMYHAATRKNFVNAIRPSTTINTLELTEPSRYETATSIAVSTTSTTAISTYWRGSGCSCACAASGVCSGAGTIAPPSSSPLSAGTSSVPGSATSVISVLGDQVDGEEDEDPYDVDEVPVQARDLYRFG